MSLEQTITENTEAIRELIATLKQNPAASTNAASNAASTNAASTNAPPAASTNAPPAAKLAVEPLKYEAIQKPFLKLANKDRPAAVALLAQLGVKKLDGVKTEQYAEVLSLIEEQLNG